MFREKLFQDRFTTGSPGLYCLSLEFLDHLVYFRTVHSLLLEEMLCKGIEECILVFQQILCGLICLKNYFLYLIVDIDSGFLAIVLVLGDLPAKEYLFVL